MLTYIEHCRLQLLLSKRPQSNFLASGRFCICFAVYPSIIFFGAMTVL